MGLALDLEDYHPSVLLHCWLGHLTCKIVSEMTYNVSSGTLNPTIPIPFHTKVHLGPLHYVALGAKDLKLDHIFKFNSLMAPPSGADRDIVKCACTVQMFPYPTMSRLFLNLNILMVVLLAQTLLFKSMTD